MTGIYRPQPVEIGTGEDGEPRAVGGIAVEAVSEEWLVEDRWWTPEPLRRRYFELALTDGRCIVVYCEAGSSDVGTPTPPGASGRAGDTGCAEDAGLGGRWFEQRA
jgi:hypothetical protein